MRRVVFVSFPDFQLLDPTGPWEVFGRTTRLLRDHGLPGGYALELAATRGGRLIASSGLCLAVQRTSRREAARSARIRRLSGGAKRRPLQPLCNRARCRRVPARAICQGGER